MHRFGAVIGFPFAMEGFAFFLEAIFLGIYLYGWDRLRPWLHWLCGVPVAISGAASAWFVVTVNAWMNAPQGFRVEGERLVEVEPVTAMLNPATGPETAHMLVAAYMVAGFLVASCYAWRMRSEPDSIYYRRAMSLALLMGVVMTPVQFVIGDWIAKHVAEFQPVKLAAMEGQFQTEAYAPARIGGWPDMAERTTKYAIQVPGMLSWLAYGERSAVVHGLDEYPLEDQPPVPVVHLSFQLMVGIGTLLLCLAAYVAVMLAWRRQVPQGPTFLWLVVLAGPLSVVALETGWMVTEVGRQPWIVQGVARTADMVTPSPFVGWSLLAAVAMYAVIGFGTWRVLRLLAAVPLAEDKRAT
jgi:cytochrome d ubiquinol oxidase subunit I